MRVHEERKLHRKKRKRGRKKNDRKRKHGGRGGRRKETSSIKLSTGLLGTFPTSLTRIKPLDTVETVEGEIAITVKALPEQKLNIFATAIKCETLQDCAPP